MGGFFGCASQENCNKELFYGTDYLSHLGTKRGGIATVDKQNFRRRIHNLENAYFRSKFAKMRMNENGLGICIADDTNTHVSYQFINVRFKF